MSDLYQIFVNVAFGRGSVLLWRRYDDVVTYRGTSGGFMDDVIFAALHAVGHMEACQYVAASNVIASSRTA